MIRTLPLTLAMLTGASVYAGAIVYVDDDAPLGGDGASWATAYRFLQDGLADATAGGVSEVRVGQGTYQPDRNALHPDGTLDRDATFRLIGGVALLGGYVGIGAENPDARDIETHVTVLSGDLAGDDGGFFTNRRNAEVVP